MTLHFFIGELSENMTQVEQRLVDESSNHGDIIRLSGFKEDYLNLTRKTIAMVAWAKEQGYHGMFKVYTLCTLLHYVNRTELGPFH
jgi:hypothetical protein